MDESEWIRVEDMHEAIIPKEIFLSVQRLLMMDTRTPPDKKSVYALSGLVKCSDCGENMVRRMTSKKGKQYHYYHCSTYKDGRGCSSHIINEERLSDMVLSVIRDNLRLLSDAKEILSDIERLPAEAVGIRTIDTQINVQMQEIDRYKELIAKLYEDMSDGIISREEYKDIRESFMSKLDTLKVSVRQNEKKKDEASSFDIKEQTWIDEFLKYRDVLHLDRRVAAELIEKIVVYDKERVEVTFRYADKISEIIEMAGRLPERDKK